MKKKVIITFLIVILFIGGYFVLNELKKKHLVNEAQEKAEEYVIENYESVESVYVTPDNYHFSPMGTLSVGGRINKTDKSTFYITFLIENNEVGEVRTIVEGPDFPSEKGAEKKDE